MTLDEADKKPEPDFDPATWTPDKPWPKGYYKPMTRLGALEARVAAADAGNPDCPASRRFLWGLLSFISQLLGIFTASAGTRNHYGLMHVIAVTFTPLPVLLFFVLAVPSVLYAAMVPKPGAPFGRALLQGLVWSLALLLWLLAMAMVRPLVIWLFGVVGAAMTP